MKFTYNEHLNPRPYLTAPHVKFHIQNNNDVEGVAICGGIYEPECYMVFSLSFVLRLDKQNQCLCCLAEHERQVLKDLSYA